MPNAGQNQGAIEARLGALPRAKFQLGRALCALAGMFLAVALPALAQETNNHLSIGAVPSWVTPIPAPALSAPAADSAPQGERYLLLDQQQNASLQSFYRHVVKEITSQEGVQNGARLQFEFDPSFQELTVHFVRI